MFKLRTLRKILGHIEFDGSNISQILKGTKKGWKSETTKKQLQEHFSNYEDYVVIYIKIFSESGVCESLCAREKNTFHYCMPMIFRL